VNAGTGTQFPVPIRSVLCTNTVLHIHCPRQFVVKVCYLDCILSGVYILVVTVSGYAGYIIIFISIWIPEMKNCANPLDENYYHAKCRRVSDPNTTPDTSTQTSLQFQPMLCSSFDRPTHRNSSAHIFMAFKWWSDECGHTMYKGSLKSSLTGGSAPLLCGGRRWLLCQVVVVRVT